MRVFKLSIEELAGEKVKIEVCIDECVDKKQLCEVLFTASNTLKKTHLSLLQTLFFCCLQVLKEDKYTMDQVRKILRHGEN